MNFTWFKKSPSSEAGKPNPKLNRLYPWLSLLIFAGVLAVGYYFVIGQQLTKLKNENAARATQAQEVKARLELHQKIVQLQTQINNYQQLYEARVSDLNRILPNEPDLPQLFSLYEDLAKQTNFRLDGLSFSLRDSQDAKPVELKQGDKTTTLPVLNSDIGLVDISLKVTGGGYEQVKNFLAVIEKNSRLTDLLGLSIGDMKPEGTSYSFNLRTYYLNKQAPVKKTTK